jgi:hypothetical protein
MKSRKRTNDTSWKERTAELLNDVNDFSSLCIGMSGFLSDMDDMSDEEFIAIKRAKDLMSKTEAYAIDYADLMDTQEKAIKELKEESTSIKKMLEMMNEELKEIRKEVRKEAQ